VACLYLMLKQGYSPIEAKAYLSSMSTKVTLGDQYLSDAQLYSIIESYTKQSVA